MRSMLEVVGSNPEGDTQTEGGREAAWSKRGKEGAWSKRGREGGREGGRDKTHTHHGCELLSAGLAQCSRQGVIL